MSRQAESNPAAPSQPAGLTDLDSESPETDLNCQIRQLRDAASQKDEFVSMVSHELRGPLTAIRGATRTLLRHGHKLEPELARKLLEDVDAEAVRLSRLLDNLLELSRAEQESSERPLRSTPLRPLLARVVAECHARAEGRSVSLQTQTALPPAHADPLLLEQVVRNLLDNAVKYSPPGSRIVVGATRRDGMLEVSVYNDGPTLEPEVLRHVFDRFYRGPEATGTRGGTGLGLTICKRLVEVQRGQIWVESNVEGGVAFRFTIPCIDGAND